MAILLYTWKDLFVEDICQMLSTDLLIYCISTKPGTVPIAAKLVLYISEKEQWQRSNFPDIVAAKIIINCLFLWSAKTKFPRKLNRKLCIVHQYLPINTVTIKYNYLIRKIELILNRLVLSR